MFLLGAGLARWPPGLVCGPMSGQLVWLVFSFQAMRHDRLSKKMGSQT